MGKCKACNYHHPYPGETSCRLFKHAKEKAKQAGNEDAWETFLDVETLVNLQTAELKIGGSESGATKPILTEQQRTDQIDKLTKKFNDLSTQFKALLDLRSTGMGASPPIISSVSHMPVPVTSGIVTSSSMPVLPAVCTAAMTGVSTTSVFSTVTTPHVAYSGHVGGHLWPPSSPMATSHSMVPGPGGLGFPTIVTSGGPRPTMAHLPSTASAAVPSSSGPALLRTRPFLFSIVLVCGSSYISSPAFVPCCGSRIHSTQCRYVVKTRISCFT